MKTLKCCDCGRAIKDDDFATEVNPEGGYGFPQMLICDECALSGRWDHRLGLGARTAEQIKTDIRNEQTNRQSPQGNSY